MTANQVSKKKMWFAAFLLFLGILVLLGSSYAAFKTTTSASKKVSITAGKFKIDFSNSQFISLTKAYPMTITDAKKQNPYKFTITNKGTITASYTISLTDEGTVGSTTMIDKQYLGYALTGTDGTNISGTVKALGSNAFTTTKKTLTGNGSDSVTYSLWIWLLDTAPNSQQNKTYQCKIAVNSTQ